MACWWKESLCVTILVSVLFLALYLKPKDVYSNIQWSKYQCLKKAPPPLKSDCRCWSPLKNKPLILKFWNFWNLVSKPMQFKGLKPWTPTVLGSTEDYWRVKHFAFKHFKWYQSKSKLDHTMEVTEWVKNRKVELNSIPTLHEPIRWWFLQTCT